MSKHDEVVKDVQYIYGEMLAVTRSCPEGFAEIAAAVLTQTVIDAEREERRHRERLDKNVR